MGLTRSATSVGTSGKQGTGRHGMWLAGGLMAAASVGAYLLFCRRTADRPERKAAPTAESATPQKTPAETEQPSHKAERRVSILVPAVEMPMLPTPFEAPRKSNGSAFGTDAIQMERISSEASLLDAQERRTRMTEHFHGVSPGESMDMDAPRSANASCRSNRSSDIDGAKLIPDLLKSRNTGHATLEIGAMLGRGSFGKVYKGRWKGAMVAIKVIEHSEEDSSKVDGLREALLCSNIQHPNVLITYKVIRKNAKGGQLNNQVGSMDSARGSQGHTPGCTAWQEDKDTSSPKLTPADRSSSMDDVHETWLISEYCDKGNLDRAVIAGRFHNKETKAPNLVAIYRCLLDIAAGMDYLHTLGVVHGDLKGGNVLLKSTSTFDDPRGFQCKIGDFGLSRVLEADTAHVTTNTYGTVSYCAPEVMKEGKLTRAADVYSFAMMMWELWMGEGLFKGLNSSQVLFKVMMGYRPPIPEDMPQGFKDLMTACWAEDPTERPPFEDVERYLRTLYYAASAGDGSRPRDSRRSLELNPWG